MNYSILNASTSIGKGSDNNCWLFAVVVVVISVERFNELLSFPKETKVGASLIVSRVPECDKCQLQSRRQIFSYGFPLTEGDARFNYSTQSAQNAVQPLIWLFEAAQTDRKGRASVSYKIPFDSRGKSWAATCLEVNMPTIAGLWPQFRHRSVEASLSMAIEWRHKSTPANAEVRTSLFRLSSVCECCLLLAVIGRTSMTVMYLVLDSLLLIIFKT